MADKDSEAILVHAARRGAQYRELSFQAITLETWREILNVAYEEAPLGDDRARIWIQRTIGLANAARIERAARAIAERVTLVDVLEASEAARRAIFLGQQMPLEDVAGAATPPPSTEPTYWSVIFEVVTPAAWERLLNAASSAALGGDPRAREWIASVLGADGAIDELGREDAGSSYVTASTLASALERASARARLRGAPRLSATRASANVLVLRTRGRRAPRDSHAAAGRREVPPNEETGKTVPLPDERFDAKGATARDVGESLKPSKAGQSAETDFLVGTGTVLPVFSCAVSAAPKPRFARAAQGDPDTLVYGW